MTQMAAAQCQPQAGPSECWRLNVISTDAAVHILLVCRPRTPDAQSLFGGTFTGDFTWYGDQQPAGQSDHQTSLHLEHPKIPCLMC